MKQTVLDVLQYLFEHYVSDDSDINLDQDQIRSRLREAGFEDNDVQRALEWLEALTAKHGSDTPMPMTTQPHAIRCFTIEETLRFDMESRGFILYLEQLGVLDPETREVVIERLMALESEEIDIRQVKWVVLMVLLNQSDREAALTWMEDMLMAEQPVVLH